MTSEPRLPLLAALLAGLLGCGPSPEGQWLGACGDSARLDMRVFVLDEADEVTGRLWTLARPDDAFDFRCAAEISGSDLSVAGCTGGWSTEGTDAPTDLTLDAAAYRGERAESLVGTCSWEGQDGGAELLRIAPSPDQLQALP